VIIKARDDPQAVADLGPWCLRLAGADPAAVARGRRRRHPDGRNRLIGGWDVSTPFV